MSDDAVSAMRDTLISDLYVRLSRDRAADMAAITAAVDGALTTVGYADLAA